MSVGPFLWDSRNREDFEILKQPHKTLLSMSLTVFGAPATAVLFLSVTPPASVTHQPPGPNPWEVRQLPRGERVIVMPCLSALNLGSTAEGGEGMSLGAEVQQPAYSHPQKDKNL